ncbi:imm11 family protein [Cohnella cholangitidis]|uniref:Immunity MXAN-0049 protein domain-containing protein n=1 Tax=Cohnella cholangitidis TaxID=2598458 RepID=A0A7G5BSY4_9BACL|nr:DUF1629 domain-containing protein [Cohnella cholangitidis]QMV40068.1 hypothetical protein FPL14_01780 [Cohnella cholangitidis]
MKIWWLDYHPDYDNLEFNNNEDFEAFESLLFGIPLIEKWIPPKMKYIAKGRSSDFLYQKDGVLFVTEKVKALFETTMLTELFEFLPVITTDGEYYILNVLNVLNVLDCVDQDRSKEDRLSSGRLIGYQEIEFIVDAVKNHDIFRIENKESNTILKEIYVSEKIRNVITNSELKGYQLVDIWDSDITQSEIEIKLNVMGELINASLHKTFNFDKALKILKTNNINVYSGRSAIKLNEDGDLMIGLLQLDGNYIWITAYSIPPTFLYAEWGIKDKIKAQSFLSRLKEVITFS